MSQILDEQEKVIILGNRKIDGGFGPYLAQVNVSGNIQKNVPMVKSGEF